MDADTENWRSSVQRDADRLLATITSNEARLAPGQVDAARIFIGEALRAVECQRPPS